MIEGLSRLGFGVSGAHGTPLVPAHATLGLIRHAFEGGVRVFDTAPAYGAGEAERRLGRALRELPRDQVFVCTKAGIASSGLARRSRDFSPAAIETSLRASLSRLDVEGVDALFLHGPDPSELTDGLFVRLAALKSAGAFIRLGVTGLGPELDAAIATGRFDLMMTPVHPFIGAREEARLAAARARGMAVIAIQSAGDTPPARRLPRRPADLYTLTRSLRPASPGRGRVDPVEGVRAALTRPDVDTVVITTTRRAHLDAHLAACPAADGPGWPGAPRALDAAPMTQTECPEAPAPADMVPTLPAAALPAPTRAAGLARLEAFIPAMGGVYAAHRSEDLGPQDRSNVSLLSAHVRRRILREDELVRAAIAAHGPEGAESFIQEVCWRTYWKGWLEMRPSVWSDYQAGLADDLHALERDGALAQRYAAAIEGRTGLEYFDAWARELKESGYLHNHARMWAASIWIYTLGLPWRLGSDWFLRHLVDADPASNTLSWRWVCGLQTQGKTYLARASNIARFTGGRFNPPALDLAAEAPPLAEDPDHPPPVRVARPARPDAGAPAFLLITGEDMHPESWGVEGLDVRGAAALDASAALSPLPIGEAANAFTRAAFDDARQRAASAFGCAVSEASSMEAVIALAREAGARQIITQRPCQGPARAALDSAAPALETAGLTMCELRRDWDQAFFPHAKKGFFKLKKAIPPVLESLGLS
ncbi:MAG: aldo/keto reductase [Oceanicaulis sp.]